MEPLIRNEYDPSGLAIYATYVADPTTPPLDRNPLKATAEQACARQPSPCLRDGDARSYSEQERRPRSVGRAASTRPQSRALDIRLNHVGEYAIATALSHNTLGELYITMNRLDDAEKRLEIAIRIRNGDGPTFDAATSRED